MKLVGMISAAVLSLTLGIAAPVFAQQEQHEQEEQKEKPAQQQEKKAQEEKPAKQQEKTAQQENKNNKPEEKNTQQENKNTKQEEKSAQQNEKNSKTEEKNAQQQSKNTKQEEKNEQQQHAQQAKSGQQAQHGGGNGHGQIPDDRYRAHFGQDHRFRVNQADYRNHRFQYGGYWFGFVSPWPANWLYTQDVFIVDIDGVYYLCNASYPGVNLTLSFTL
jgi:outer membrane biosynthesis protein TonB